MVGVLASLAVPATVWAHGYHAAGAQAASLMEWEKQAAAALNLERVNGESSGSGAMRAGTDLRELARGTPPLVYRRKQIAGGQVSQAQLNDLMDVLAWMTPQNVIPQEFPNLVGRIPEFRKTAKNLLAAVGRDAIPRLLQDLEIPPRVPPDSDRCTLAASFVADVLEVLAAMGRQAPDERYTSAQVTGYLALAVQSNAGDKVTVGAMRTLLSLLTTTELLKLPARGDGLVGRLKREELFVRLRQGDREVLHDGGMREEELAAQFKALLTDDPDLFAELRTEFADLGPQFEQALAETSPGELKRLYKKTENANLLLFLLEKPTGWAAVEGLKLDDPKLQAAVQQAVEKPTVTLKTAQAALRMRKLGTDELRSLVSSPKRWEQIGAYGLLLEELPKTSAEAAWLFARAASLPADVQPEISRGLAGRAADAPTPALVQSLTSPEPALVQKAISVLRDRASSAEDRQQLRAAQSPLIAAFNKSRTQGLGLVRILGSIRSRAALEALVDALDDGDAKVWRACRDELCIVEPKNLSFGPVDNADATTRAAARERWRAWLEKYQEPR
jgi:hypothetical protein